MRELVIVMAKILLVLAKRELLSWRGAYNYALEQADVKEMPSYMMKHFADQVTYLAPKINEMEPLINELEIRLREAEER